MATKIYLPSSGSPAVTPSTWNHANQAGTTYTLPGVLIKSNTSMANRVTATGTTSPYTRAVMRYIIGPLAASEISGTIRLQMLALEASTGANATFSIAVKIIQPGGADRSVLLAAIASDSATSPYEFPITTATNRRAYNLTEVQPVPLTAQTPTAGDYLVIEIGFRSATTTTRNITLRHGDDGTTDLGDNTTDTDQAYNPYVEFSANLPWQADLPTVTTQDATDLAEETATGNGNITDTGGANCDQRGVVYDAASHGDPGNVAPASSGYAGNSQESGNYGTGAFTRALTDLNPNQLYYARAWAHNAAGYAYGGQVSFTTLNWPVRLKASSYIPAGGTTATTRQLSIPSGKVAGDFEAGTITDDTNPLASFNPGNAKFSEWEICIETIDALTHDGDEIELRLTNAGTVLDAYDHSLSWTIGTGVTGNLGTASASASATASGTLTTAIPLAAAVNATVAAAAPLTSAIKAVASVLCSATLAAILTTSILLAAIAPATATATSVLTSAIPLTATANTTATVAADLTAAGYDPRIASAVSGGATATGELTSAIPLAASLGGTVAAVAPLTSQITLAVVLPGTATATANLTAAAGLAADLDATASVTGALITAITCAANVTGTATSAGALTTSILLAGTATGSATTAAILTAGDAIRASVTCTATAQAALVSAITMAATPTCTATVVAPLAMLSKFAAAVATSATVQAELRTAITLAASKQGTATMVATLTTAIPCAATLLGTANITGILTTPVAFYAQATCAVFVEALFTAGIPLPDIYVGSTFDLTPRRIVIEWTPIRTTWDLTPERSAEDT